MATRINYGEAVEIKHADVRTIQLALRELGYRMKQADIYACGYLMNVYAKFNLPPHEKEVVYHAVVTNRMDRASTADGKRYWRRRKEEIEDKWREREFDREFERVFNA